MLSSLIELHGSFCVVCQLASFGLDDAAKIAVVVSRNRNAPIGA